MKNKKILFIIIAAIIVTGIIGLIISRRSGGPPEQFLDIGVVLPLTGPASDIGKWQQKGLDLAVEQINAQRGANLKKLRLVYQDSAGDPKTGLSAFSQILAQSKPPVVISSLSSVSNAILPISQQQQVNTILLAVSLPAITKQSQYAYRFNVGSEDEARVMANYITNQAKLNRIAVYYMNDEFGLGALEVFRQDFGKAGGQIVWEEPYAGTATEHRSSLSKMTKTGAQGVYVIGFTRASALAIKQLREAGSKMPVFANMALTVPTFTQLIGDAIEGATFTTNYFDASTNDERVRNFVQAYTQRYNEPPTFFGAFAYDSLQVIAPSITNPDTAAADIRAGLVPQRQFAGVMGAFSVDAERNFRFPVKLVQFKQGKLQEIAQ
jgi:branched-chain amino acid transport system substrate-binding protein